MTTEVVLEVKGLRKTFATSGDRPRGLFSRAQHPVKAVDGVDLTVRRGETVAVVGESGSGKSTLARSILLLDRPTGGQVWFKGTDIVTLSNSDLRPVRRELQAVFQDPASSLNPRMRVFEIVTHGLRTHGLVKGRAQRIEAAGELLKMVELRPQDAMRLPHQLSLGQRQRIAIARAIALRPAVVIADEPVSALDVSVQAHVLAILGRLSDELGLSYILIAHDLRVVRQVAERVYIMYAGQVVEAGPVESVFETPDHPYTEALLASVPRIGVPLGSQVVGEPANPRNLPPGCRFSPRCPYVQPVCREVVPQLVALQGDGERWTRCMIPRSQRVAVSIKRETAP